MTGRWRRFVRNLTGRSDDTLVSHLLDQLDATRQAAQLARDLAAGEVASDAAIERIDELEATGDDARRILIEELRHTLATPIDREDLNRLSRSADDILDNLRDLVREFHLYGLDDEPLLLSGIDHVTAGIDGLHAATRCLIDHPEDAARQAADAKKNDVRRSYQQAMADLLGDGRTGRHGPAATT